MSARHGAKTALRFSIYLQDMLFQYLVRIWTALVSRVRYSLRWRPMIYSGPVRPFAPESRVHCKIHILDCFVGFEHLESPPVKRGKRKHRGPERHQCLRNSMLPVAIFQHLGGKGPESHWCLVSWWSL